MNYPSNHDLELGILGTVALFTEHSYLLDQLTEDDFFNDTTKEWFKRIRANHENEQFLLNGLRETEIDTLKRHYYSDIHEAIKLAQSLKKSRLLIDYLNSTVSNLLQGAFHGAVTQDLLKKISQLDETGDTISSMYDSLIEVFEKIAKVKDGEEDIGLRCGLDFESHISGFEPGKLYIVAARPAMGKSAFALEIAKRIASQKKAVGFMSLEMSNTSLAFRLLTSDLGMDGKDLRNGRVSDEEMQVIGDACQKLAEYPIYFDDNSFVTAQSLRSRAAYFKKQKNIEMLIIDYLQLMSGNNESRERDIAEVSRMCKVISKELQIPVIALAQLNRGVEMRENKRPRLSDLRESGAIEQDADAVMFLYRPEYYGLDHYPEGDEFSGQSTKNICEVIIGKNRDGETGYVPQIFIPELMQFKNRESESVLSEIF